METHLLRITCGLILAVKQQALFPHTFLFSPSRKYMLLNSDGHVSSSCHVFHRPRPGKSGAGQLSWQKFVVWSYVFLALTRVIVTDLHVFRVSLVISWYSF